MKQIVEFFGKKPGVQLEDPLRLATALNRTRPDVIAGLRVLTKRGYLNRFGNSLEGFLWELNPDYPGTIADAVNVDRGEYLGGHQLKLSKSKIVEIRKKAPKGEVAGPAYYPPAAREPYEPKYYEELTKLQKLAEFSREKR
jgi:hypothetical protein